MSLDLSPVNIEGRNIIQSYGNGKFQISDKEYDHSVLVFSDQIIPWAPIDTNNLIIDDFKKVLEVGPIVELLLLGCGKTTWFLPLPLRDELKEMGLVLEPMDTGAACRTFNVLLGEDRKIAAALMLVD
ncbi:Mth938-like domain-containing protein [Rhodospirillales bacterium]|nr:Mth938-like domain-containing protein [Rhodospirillales bacterium]